GYDAVFEYQLQSVARPGDVLIAVSSSGRSPNIVRVLEWANGHGMETIALTGFSGGAARELASVSVHVRSDNYGIIEDAHQACMHLLAKYVRQSRMPPDTFAATTFGENQACCHQSPDRRPRQSVRGPLVLDAGDPGNGRPYDGRRGTSLVGEP